MRGAGIGTSYGYKAQVNLSVVGLGGDRKGRTCTHRKGLGWSAVNPECGILLPGELGTAPSSAAATSPSPASGHGDK